jgi:hypothetical protein
MAIVRRGLNSKARRRLRVAFSVGRPRRDEERDDKSETGTGGFSEGALTIHGFADLAPKLQQQRKWALREALHA